MYFLFITLTSCRNALYFSIVTYRTLFAVLLDVEPWVYLLSHVSIDVEFHFYSVNYSVSDILVKIEKQYNMFP